MTIGPLQDGEETVTDNEQMASLLNKWHCSVFTDENLANMLSPEKLYERDKPLNWVHITAGKVEKELAAIKPTAATGPDKIWLRVLHDLADVLAEPVETGECHSNLQVRNQGETRELQTSQLNFHCMQGHGVHPARRHRRLPCRARTTQTVTAWILEEKKHPYQPAGVLGGADKDGGWGDGHGCNLLGFQ